MQGWIVLVILPVGVAVGVLVGWLWAERRARVNAGAMQSELAVATGRVSDLQAQLLVGQSTVEQLRAQHGQAERQNAALAAQYSAAQENLVEQRRLLEDAQVKLRDAFAGVSAEALAKNNEAFLTLAGERFAKLSTQANGSLDERKAQIEAMMKPMGELLAQYQLRLTDVERVRNESYSALREQLGTLAEAQRTLNTQTHQLVGALSRPTTRGQWGEITLRRLVELAGMSKHCDFEEQATVENDESRQRPDMVVHLPNGRQIIIDCKAVLSAFLDATEATDEKARVEALVRHAQQVRSRVRELSAKAYWNQFAGTPDFVVMFLPGESFLYAAVGQDTSLIEDGIRNNIVIATPTTLIALLKTVAFGWRQEQIAENAEQIRALGAELYDRITTLSGYFSELGKSLGSAMKHYNKAVVSLESRLIVSARKMSELGVRADRTIDEPPTIDARPRPLSISEETSNPA